MKMWKIVQHFFNKITEKKCIKMNETQVLDAHIQNNFTIKKNNTGYSTKLKKKLNK